MITEILITDTWEVRMHKKILFTLVGFIFLVSNVRAVEYPEVKSWVNDYAQVLSEREERQLIDRLKEFEATSAVQIFVALLERFPDNDITLEEYVNELFERWQPGQNGQDNGVLLVIFMENRQLRIEVGYGLETTLTDAICQLIITNEITPLFKQARFYDGIRNGLDSIIHVLEGTYQPRSPRKSFWEKIGREEAMAILLFALLMSSVVLVLVLQYYFPGSPGRTRCSSRKTTHKHPGWNSSRSFDNFSGGGGGKSGGGGASGEW